MANAVPRACKLMSRIRNLHLRFTALAFFFQAEDGIRDHCVTGGQTCALPISSRRRHKSTRLNSSHTVISYAVFCLRSQEHTSELQSHSDLLCRLPLDINNQTTSYVCTSIGL